MNKVLLLKEVEALEAHPLPFAGFVVHNPLVAAVVIVEIWSQMSKQ